MSRILAILLLLVALPARAEVILEGAAEQGGLMVAQTAPGATAMLDGRDLPVDSQGRFLLGFGRNAESAELVVIGPDGQREERRIVLQKRDWQIQRIDGLPQEQVTPDPKLVERIRRENGLIAEKRQIASDLPGWSGGFVRPAEGVISGVFGSQRILNGEPRSPHSGTDFAAPEGAPVLAAASGMVSMVHPDMFLTGQSVMIDHGQGLSSIYIHMSDIAVAEGQQVAKGEVIGKVGKTGRVTGPHLHFGVSLFDIKLDPETVLRVLGD